MATRKPGSGPERRRAGTRAAGKGGQGDPGETPLRIGERFARVTAPLQLADAERRAQWGLPSLAEPDKTGPYIVELNLEHISGLAGAVQAFKEIHKQALSEASGKGARRSVPSPGVREPVPIAKSYYLCELKDKEWRSMVELDEAKPSRERAIYRLWPDFPVSAHTNRSMSTIKADAAMRSFDAAGAQIAWAVVDSGIDASHPHFGSADDEQRSQHALCCDEVVALHRCFADLHEVRNGVVVARPPLGNPDAASAMPAEERKRLLDEHRKYALSDDYGHGTHVAGIIAGQAPREGAEVWALEREFKVVGDDVKQSATYAPRTFTDGEPRPRGVAPRCRLVSLRVLDHEGRGRASRVIQALEFIRNFINDNPKKMRVHGVNLSVGYEYDAELFACGQSPLCTAVDRLVQEGVVVVTAAGNTGYGTAAADVGASRMCLSNSINDPGNAALAITVGATHKDSPHTYGVSYFSSKGPTGDGRMKPDLVAPGERIISCAAGKKLRDARSDGVQTSPDTGAALYIDDSGTSMAAPHVSGAIAAFLSIRREFIGKPLEVKRIFLESATPLGREGYFEGRGLVDLMRAIQLV